MCVRQEVGEGVGRVMGQVWVGSMEGCGVAGVGSMWEGSGSAGKVWWCVGGSGMCGGVCVHVTCLWQPCAGNVSSPPPVQACVAEGHVGQCGRQCAGGGRKCGVQWEGAGVRCEGRQQGSGVCGTGGACV